VRLLISDHEEVAELVADLAQRRGDESGGRRALAEQLARRLRAHMMVTRELLVPAVRERAADGERRELDAAGSVSAEVEAILDELSALDPRQAPFDERLSELRERLVQHVDQEETLLGPRAEDLLTDEELLTLGARMERRRAELLVPATSRAVGAVVRVVRTAALILAAGAALAVLGRLRRRPMRSSRPRPPRRALRPEGGPGPAAPAAARAGRGRSSTPALSRQEHVDR